MADCDAKKEEKDCGGNFDRCGKMSVNFKVASLETKVYSKGCATKDLCSTGSEEYKTCKNIEGATCELECCEGDLCNGGTVPVVSAVLMVACVLMALVR